MSHILDMILNDEQAYGIIFMTATFQVIKFILLKLVQIKNLTVNIYTMGVGIYTSERDLKTPIARN